MGRPHEDEPKCPRCGYDLRGTVATWPQYGFCPLEGVCTECGLHFEWANVYDPGLSEPAWCVEYIAKKRLVRGCAGTAMRSSLPWRFWSRLRMHHRVRPRRLAMYVLFLLAVWLVLYVGAQTAIVMAARHWSINAAANYWTGLPARILMFESRSFPRPDITDLRRQAAAAPPNLERSALVAIVDAVINPLRAEPCTVIWETQTPEYQMTLGEWLGINGIYVSQLGLAAAFGLVLYALLPLSLVLLPISRRQARVQWRHIGRIATYGLVIPVGVLGAVHVLIAIAVSPVWVPLSGRAWAAVLPLAGAGIPALLTVWWALAMRCHLKLAHAWTTAVLLSIVCALVIVWMLYLLRVEIFV